MKKKTGKLSKKKYASLVGAIALIAVIAGGGYYLSEHNSTTTDNTSQEQKQIQENLDSKAQQIEENTKNESSSTSTNNQTTGGTTSTPTSANLSSVSITAMKDGTTVYLSVYGIAAGKYDVEKNGKTIVSSQDYLGHGGLALPNQTEASANYQVFQIVNGKRSASSKIITVTTSFTLQKEFTGA